MFVERGFFIDPNRWEFYFACVDEIAPRGVAKTMERGGAVRADPFKVFAECFEDCRPTVNFCNFLVQFAPRERTVTVSNNVVLLFDIPMAVCPIGFFEARPETARSNPRKA